MPRATTKKAIKTEAKNFTVILNVSNEVFTYPCNTIFEGLKQITKAISFKTLPKITVTHGTTNKTMIVPVRILRRLINNDVTKKLFEKRFKVALGIL